MKYLITADVLTMRTLEVDAPNLVLQALRDESDIDGVDTVYVVLDENNNDVTEEVMKGR